MKKLSTLFFVLFLLLSPIQSVSAAAFYATVSGPTQITAGQEFTIIINVSNTTSFQGFTATLNFDKTKISLVSSKILVGLDGWGMDIGTKIVMIGPEKSGSFKALSLTFKATSNFVVGQSTTVKLNDIYYSTQFGDYYDLDVNNNHSERLITIRMVSDNSYLKALTVSQGSLSFSKTTTDYVVDVENNVSSITLGATADYSKSTISGLGTKTLAIYSNVFNIVVTAENGSKRTYSVNVRRKDANGLASPPSTNNYLREIKFTGYEEFNLAFVKETLDYVLDVGNLVTSVEMIVTADDSKSKLDITQTPLELGPNVFTIKVTAENGDIKTYTITVNRSSDVPTVDETEIIAALLTVTTPSIGLIMPSSWEISSEILTALKTSGKTLIVVMKLDNQTQYEWLIDGTKITDTSPIKAKVTFDSLDEEKIELKTNYANGVLLSFEENLSLPDNTLLRLTVSSNYRDGDKINLYYYDSKTNKLSLSSKDLLVANGKVEIPLTHTSTYFLSQAQIKTIGVMDYLFVLVSIVEACIIVVLLLRRKTPRKEKSALPDN